MLLFQNKLPVRDRAKIITRIHRLSGNLGIDPNWLMAVINFETIGSFNPATTNGIGAVGLIQFVEDFKNAGYKTIGGKRVLIRDIKNMSFLQQLDFVEAYYRPFKHKIHGFTDLYLATFFPAAMGKPDSYVLQTNKISAGTIAKQNPVFDKFPKDNKITVGEIKRVLLLKVPAEYMTYLVKQNSNLIGWTFGIATASLVGYKLYQHYGNRA